MTLSPLTDNRPDTHSSGHFVAGNAQARIGPLDRPAVAPQMLPNVQFVPSPSCVHPTSALIRSPQAPRSKPLTHHAAVKDAMRRTKAASVFLHSPSSHRDVRRLANGSCNHWYACRDYPPRCIGAEQEQLALGTPVSRSSAAELVSDQRRGYGRADGESSWQPAIAGPR